MRGRSVCVRDVQMLICKQGPSSHRHVLSLISSTSSSSLTTVTLSKCIYILQERERETHKSAMDVEEN